MALDLHSTKVISFSASLFTHIMDPVTNSAYTRYLQHYNNETKQDRGAVQFGGKDTRAVYKAQRSAQHKSRKRRKRANSRKKRSISGKKRRRTSKKKHHRTKRRRRRQQQGGKHHSSKGQLSSNF